MMPKPNKTDPGLRSVWGFPRKALAELNAAHVRFKYGRPFKGILRNMA